MTINVKTYLLMYQDMEQAEKNCLQQISQAHNKLTEVLSEDSSLTLMATTKYKV